MEIEKLSKKRVEEIKIYNQALKDVLKESKSLGMTYYDVEQVVKRLKKGRNT